jgi:hypothetical protein
MPLATQAQVNYRRGFAANQCGKCCMYRKNAGQYGTCTAVTGGITAYGVCDLYQGLTNPFGALPHHERVARVHGHLQRLLGQA